VNEELHGAFKEDHSAAEIALSFALGIFITVIPTMGLGLIMFLFLDRISEKISILALMSTVLFINPFVKPFFYISSIKIGALILGVEVSTTISLFLLIKALYVGSFVIALFLAVTSYFVVLESVEKYRKSGFEIIEEIEKTMGS